jgi:predicted histidine transporter YuiF (NhaC family)
MDRQTKMGKPRLIKFALLSSILLMAIASQNLIPVHIAFIPILIPPLLTAFNRLYMDRRQVACVITFGLTATYMLLPIGFGNIYLNEILAANLRTNGLDTTGLSMSNAMLIPVFGMFLGMLTAVFITYHKPRKYRPAVIMIKPKKAIIFMPCTKMPSAERQQITPLITNVMQPTSAPKLMEFIVSCAVSANTTASTVSSMFLREIGVGWSVVVAS